MDTFPKAITFNQPVADALRKGLPVLAFESAVITHGLPRPHNLALARSVEAEALSIGVVPATIALLNQRVHIGLDDDELEQLAAPPAEGQPLARKISRRDFGIALATGVRGGTTVAGTLIAARSVGIRVFATGGIGGVHRNAPFDVSADLPELAHSPLVVVCAGAKAILDLPATLEYLETSGVPVIGFETAEFPAFYSRESGLPVDARVDSADEVAEIARAQWGMGLAGAILVVVPPPMESAIPAAQVEACIQQALEEARAQSIRGSAVTPFLLARVSELSHGSSMTANLALLRNNARVGALIARALVGPGGRFSI
jgi:pseudouridine-5'-phosphate glycosidase